VLRVQRAYTLVDALTEKPVIADIMGSSSPEVLIAGVNQLLVFENTENGFAAPVATSFATTSTALATTDLDADGHIDALQSDETSNDVVTLFGHGHGSFSEARRFGVEAGPIDLALGDFDADGLSDVAVVNVDAASVSVLFGSRALVCR